MRPKSRETPLNIADKADCFNQAAFICESRASSNRSERKQRAASNMPINEAIKKTKSEKVNYT